MLSGVTDVRVGLAIRAVRVRKGWRQSDLARRASVSPSVVSLIERGHLSNVSVPAVRRVVGELEIRADITLTLPHGELDRLVNAGHAALHEAIARYVASLPGWLQAPEVTFAVYRDRGVIDILAFHEPTRSLLVIELKTELVSLEDILRTTDMRMRHARSIAAERGWEARSVSSWLVFAESRTTRRRIAAHAAALRSAFPGDGIAMRHWLAGPAGTIRAMSMWTDSRLATASRSAAARRRVRVRAAAVGDGHTAA
jgi:transcriptional regulator with XRE-family HTH domain